MKIYTNTLDLATPITHQFCVPQNSDFGIGIKVVRNGADVEGDITLESNGQTFAAEDEKIAGFTIFNSNSQGAGKILYTVTCNGQKFTLAQVAVKSSVIEKKTEDIRTEYVIAIGNIDDGVLSRSALSNVVEVSAHALEGAFAGNMNLQNVGFPNMTTIGESGMQSTFSNCSALETVDMSKLSSVDSNGLSATFDGCTSLEFVLFKNSAAIPDITETTFANTNDTYKVIVPDDLYENWISASVWSDISSHVTKVSDYAAVMTNYGGYDNIDD